MNTTDQEQGEEARNFEEVTTTIVPMDETSVDEPEQDEPEQDEPAGGKRLPSLAELGLEVAAVHPHATSQEIRIMPSMGLTGPKKKSGSGEIRMGTRAQWAEMIKQHAPTLMAYHKRVALSANEVLAALKANDLMVEDIEHANGIGDALGACGLRLPPVVGAGPKHYYMPAANMTAEERAEFDALPALDKVRLIREGNAALKDGEA
jgi:hypothetical protein